MTDPVPRTRGDEPLHALKHGVIVSHRVLVGRAEIGAARPKRSTGGRDDLGLKLDDPSFAHLTYANLFDDESGEGYNLIWSRPNTRRGD